MKQEFEKAGLDSLKALAEAGKSIITIYLNGCSPAEKARIRRDLNALLTMGITVDMVLDEVALQIPEIIPIMKDRVAYRKSEIEKVMSFLKEG
ncbi:hypothetical protein ES703_89556 [subsurface metagenome]